MKRRKVISHDNMQMRSPVLLILVVWLVLDKFNVPGWGWGVFITLAIIVVIAFIAELANTEYVDVIKDN